MKYLILIALCLFCHLLPAQSLGLQQLGNLGGELSSTGSPVLVHSIGATAATIIANDQIQVDQGMFLACDLPCSTVKTSISQSIFEQSALSVYPNPTRGDLYLKGEGLDRYHYRLFQSTGQLVKEGSVQQSRISMNELPTGIYLLRAYDHTGNLKLVSKVIKH